MCPTPITPVLGSQGGQVGYSPDFHPDGPGSTLARGNQRIKKSKPPSVPKRNDQESLSVL